MLDIGDSRGLEGLARRTFLAAVAQCAADRAVAARVELCGSELRIPGAAIDLTRYDEARIVAIGKASGPMLRAFGKILAGFPALELKGLAVAHETADAPFPAWSRRIVGSHPFPDARSFEAGRALLDFVGGCTAETLVVFLLSGGGSALVEWPLDERLAWDDFARLNEALTRSRLPIRSINAVRKHLSAIKGGRLARRAMPAAQLTLVISDVEPGDVQSVASGPTVPDETTVEDVARALDEGAIRDRLPETLRRALAPGAVVETPKGEDLGGGDRWIATILDSSSAAEAARREALSFADAAEVDANANGPLEPLVDGHLRRLARLVSSSPPGGVCAYVSAGEVTLDVTGDGRGGRNQHTVLYALTRVAEICPALENFAILSAGTDGRDGPTDAAGAVAGSRTLGDARARGLDVDSYLRRHDAYSFFEPLGGLVVTGATRTNVRDVRVFIGRAVGG